MAETMKRLAPGSDGKALTDVALRGSFWFFVQSLLNKICTAGATLVIAYFLSPEEYGLAGSAVAVAAFLRIMPPELMGDVLVARARRLEWLGGTARALSGIIGGAGCAVMLAAIPVVLRIYDSYPAGWLAGLLAVLAVSSLFSAALVVPIASLRLRFQFRRMAGVEGVLQLAATVLSVGFAAGGTGATALVAPQVIKEAGRALWYTRIDAPARYVRRFHRGAARALMRSYATAAGSQYLHGALMGLEMAVLGYVAGGYEAGIFGFAFTVAVQANRVLTSRLQLILQPTLGVLQRQSQRQVDGLLRAQRLLGAVCVPVALLQVVMAEPLFHLLLLEKWWPSTPVFQILSLMQAFYFASGPTMACLKAQRRFPMLLLWPSVQLLLSFPVYWFGARHGGAIGAAAASALMWSISIPIGTWLCTRFRGPGRLRATIGAFTRPWLVALPVFGPGYFVVGWLGDWGKVGYILAIFLVGPVLLALVMAINWRFDSEFRSTFRRVWNWIRSGNPDRKTSDDSGVGADRLS